MRSTPVRIVVAALSCAACSSTGTTPAGTTPAPVSVYAQSGGANAGLQGVTLVTGGTAQTTTLTATREAIWPHLVGAYASLGIPLTQQDEATFKLGNTQLKARRALNNLQLRTALDCGSDLAGEKAESYELRITIESSLATAGSGTGTELTTSVLRRRPLRVGQRQRCQLQHQGRIRAPHPALRPRPARPAQQVRRR